MPDINAAMTAATANMIDAIGMSATYTPAGGEATTVTILFDNLYQLLQVEGLSVEGRDPVAFGKSTDFASAAQGDALTIGGVNYVIAEVKPDGTGGVELQLRSA